MTPEELYKRKPESIEKDLNCLFGCYFSHVPEIQNIYPSDFSEDANERIEIHCYKDFDFDGRRAWVLASIKFDDEFIMIIQNAGREGDDHAERFITNKEKYIEMVSYIRSILPVDANLINDMVDITKEIPKLTSFYGNKLDGSFERY